MAAQPQTLSISHEMPFGAEVVPGGVAPESLVLSATMCEDETKFQLASTALTVTLKAPPAV